MVEPYPSEKYDFVSWDDDYSQYMAKEKMFQTTNQIIIGLILGYFRENSSRKHQETMVFTIKYGSSNPMKAIISGDIPLLGMRNRPYIHGRYLSFRSQWLTYWVRPGLGEKIWEMHQRNSDLWGFIGNRDSYRKFGNRKLELLVGSFGFCSQYRG